FTVARAVEIEQQYAAALRGHATGRELHGAARTIELFRERRAEENPELHVAPRRRNFECEKPGIGSVEKKWCERDRGRCAHAHLPATNSDSVPNVAKVSADTSSSATVKPKWSSIAVMSCTTACESSSGNALSSALSAVRVPARAPS